jgi:hypothetical protein
MILKDAEFISIQLNPDVRTASPQTNVKSKAILATTFAKPGQQQLI